MGRKATKRRQPVAAHDDASRARSSSLLWICLALTALNLFIYSPVGGFEFVNWDDPSYITENAQVMKGLARRVAYGMQVRLGISPLFPFFTPG